MDQMQRAQFMAELRGYSSVEEMVELTKIDWTKIDDNDERTWPPEKVLRTITVQVVGRGHFAVHEGEVHNIGMGWDEMLGHLAAMTIPDVLKKRGHIYPMTTDAEDIKQIERRIERRIERDKNPFSDFEIVEPTTTTEPPPA